MNWKLIFGLSLFGLAMGLATIFWVPSNVEPLFWLVIFVICALLTAWQLSSRHFIHGLLVGVVNSVWVTAAHIAWFDRYMANHPKEAAMSQSMKVDPKTVQEFLRQAHVTTTLQLYAQSDMEAKREAQAKFLDEMLGDRLHLLTERIQ